MNINKKNQEKYLNKLVNNVEIKKEDPFCEIKQEERAIIKNLDINFSTFFLFSSITLCTVGAVMSCINPEGNLEDYLLTGGVLLTPIAVGNILNKKPLIK